MSTSMTGTSSGDPYAVLGVPEGTPFAEIKAVYRGLVRELHPDVNPGDPRARERFEAVQAAFEALRTRNVAERRHHPPHSTRDATSHAAAADTGQRETASAAPEQHREPAPVQARGPATGGVGRAAPVPTAAPAPPAAAPPSSSDAAVLQVAVVPGRDRLLLQPRAQMLYMLLELKLDQRITSSSQPLNVSLVLDHSSSMQRDDKLQRLKEAVARIIEMMGAHDYLSIVTFGDRASVLLPSQPLGNKRAAREALDGIRCRGGTEISTGIRAGLQELQGHSAHLISQMIVLTDGQTYGDEELCLALATQAGERQVQITALGLGDDWNSALLDEIAARTGGHADYVQSADKLSSAFEEHLRMLQMTALRNMRLLIATGISSRVLRATWVAPGIKPLPVPEEVPAGQVLELDLGRMSTDRDYRLLLELVVAARSAGPTPIGDLRFTYDVPGMDRERETVHTQLSATFVERWDSDPPVDLRVHDALRKITAQRLQEQAMQAIHEGQTQKGTANLRTAARHLEAAGCGELADLAKAEADRVERHGQAQAGSMKRIIYGTRRLG